MADRPILFSSAMVKALLAGTKTQTRRVLKPQPEMAKIGQPCHPEPRGNGRWVWMARDDRPDYQYATADFRVRFAVGDRLWVRETWSQPYAPMAPDATGTTAGYIFRADGPEHNSPSAAKHQWASDGDWRPSIYMPRRASRLTLTVTDVRVQRLQEISEADAVAEGMFQHPPDGSEAAGAWTGGIDFLHGNSARGAFFRTWEQINGAGSWAANLWVVAITFTVERRNIDEAKP